MDACVSGDVNLLYYPQNDNHLNALEDVLDRGELSDAAIIQATIISTNSLVGFGIRQPGNIISLAKIRIKNVIMLKDMWHILPVTKAYCSENTLKYERLAVGLEKVFEDESWIVYTTRPGDDYGVEYNVPYKNPCGQKHLLLYYFDHPYIFDCGCVFFAGNVVC